MSKPKEITRDYQLEDAMMLEWAKTRRSFFIADKADFIAFDVVFNDPYAATWQTAITAAEVFVSDNAAIDQLVQKTNTVEAKMKECRDYFQTTKYFIEKAFPGDVAVWNEFGYNDYDEARNRQSKMIEFMTLFYTVADKYKTKLIAAGFLQVKITQINTLKTQLSDANIEQKSFKGVRPVLTQDRIILLNKVWGITSGEVSRVGKLIYTGNYAKYRRYLLPVSEQSAFPKEGEVEGGATITIISGKFTASQQFILKNTGATELIFSLAAGEDEAGEGGVSALPGTEQTVAVSNLGKLEFTFLNVTNQSPDKQGSFELDKGAKIKKALDGFIDSTH